MERVPAFRSPNPDPISQSRSDLPIQIRSRSVPCQPLPPSLVLRDESTKFGLGLLSSNTQIETHDGKTVDVVMRGATLTAGGTAEAIAWSIDKNIFSHARRLLEGWRSEHESKHGAGSWAAAGGPAPGSIGLNRLTENTLLMSDTCNAARKCKRLLAEAAYASLKADVGEEVWEQMSEEERAAKGKVYVGQCHAHLRNIIINAMAARGTESLKNELSESLAEFSSFDRMSVDGNDLIRAVFKELHEGGEYAKGKSREYWAWARLHHASEMLLGFECANGSRQDIAFDGAVAIFWNRKIILEFLKSLLVPGAPVLELAALTREPARRLAEDVVPQRVDPQ